MNIPERVRDTLDMLVDHDVATLTGGEFACIFESSSREPFQAQGYAPTMLLPGKRVDGDTATVYGVGCSMDLSVGDTVTEITDADGETWGPFVVEVIRPQGTGAIDVQMREST